MTRRTRTTRTGVAMLITLVTLVLTVTAVTGLASVAVSHKLDGEFSRFGMMADDLAIAADQLIIEWLEKESGEVVLPVEATSPQVLVLHHLWNNSFPNEQPTTGHSDDLIFELRITAWDQCGMVPIAMAKAGSPLRLALPEHVLQTLDSVDAGERDSSGLDLFSRPFDPESASPFPLPQSAVIEDLQVFGTAAISGSAGAQTLLSAHESGPLAAGAYFSTHGERLNVNTAPLAVLEQGLRLAGRGGIEVVMAARSEGRSASLASLPSLEHSSDTSAPVTGVSDAWAFRIDARVGPVQRSWWAVYMPAPQGNSNRRAAPAGSPSWQCVQRIVIRD